MYKKSLEEHLNNIVESKSFELKSWLDPDNEEHLAVIVKNIIALFNEDGGYLAIGFDDHGKSSDKNRLENTREKYHIDTIQLIVHKYTSINTEIFVKYHTINNIEHPIICIPGGFRSIVCARKDIKNSKGIYLIKKNQIFVRSIRNGVVSTTEPTGGDDLSELSKRVSKNNESELTDILSELLTDEKVKNKAKELIEIVLAPGSLNPQIHQKDATITEQEDMNKTKLLEIEKYGFERCLTKLKPDVPKHGF